jgi:catechol 2,3-dioxygenase-like lactoylglutathione lyase family enzyme
MLSRPKAHGGLRHLALFVANFDETLHFYTELLGMVVEWQPDPDNIYLCSGCDNLALHRYQGGERPVAGQRLDHLGFIIKDIDDVDLWHAYLQVNAVPIKAAPRTHRDGARSFYCLDPDGNLVQMIYHPPISGVY